MPRSPAVRSTKATRPAASGARRRKNGDGENPLRSAAFPGFTPGTQKSALGNGRGFDVFHCLDRPVQRPDRVLKQTSRWGESGTPWQCMMHLFASRPLPYVWLVVFFFVSSLPESHIAEPSEPDRALWMAT
jgi:hypothetical protein